MATREEVLDVLRAVRYPGLDRDIVALDYVPLVEAEGDRWHIRLAPRTSQPEAAAAIEAEVRQRLEAAGIAYRLERDPGEAPAATHEAPRRPVIEDLAPGVQQKVAVASGKGGVGKSTVAVNLALALAAEGQRVGLLDADIYGPSIPTMLGVTDARPVSEDGKIRPVSSHGIQAISLGFLVSGLDPIIWRGPLASRAIEQLLSDVDWSGVETLVLDLPPGTGDVQISIAQKANPSGALIVTTPQDVSLIDAIRGVRMFHKVDIPVLGLVENMSHFVCPHCGAESQVFAPGTLRHELERLEIPILGRLPIDPAIAAGGDSGRPIVSSAPETATARAYRELGAAVARALAERRADARGEHDVPADEEAAGGGGAADARQG